MPKIEPSIPAFSAERQPKQELNFFTDRHGVLNALKRMEGEEWLDPSYQNQHYLIDALKRAEAGEGAVFSGLHGRRDYVIYPNGSIALIEESARPEEIDQARTLGIPTDIDLIKQREQQEKERELNLKTNHEATIQALIQMEGAEWATPEWQQQQVGDGCRIQDAIDGLERGDIGMVIHGKGGLHRYHVNKNGDISLSEMHSSPHAQERAKKLGFKVE
ncbi:hypothetical protein GF380_01995 [Candidatus Uhrbacteria bacterium]|nr:hypothetical protein [Candidatus Uhrbacteria bacterium]